MHTTYIPRKTRAAHQSAISFGNSFAVYAETADGWKLASGPYPKLASALEVSGEPGKRIGKAQGPGLPIEWLFVWAPNLKDAEGNEGDGWSSNLSTDPAPAPVVEEKPPVAEVEEPAVEEPAVEEPAVEEPAAEATIEAVAPEELLTETTTTEASLEPVAEDTPARKPKGTRKTTKKK